MTPINYVITDDAITFFRDDQVKIVTREQSYLFPALQESLLSGLFSFDISQSPRELILQTIKNNRGLYELAERLEALESEGLPTEPFISFISRLDEETLIAGLNKIKIVGTPELPLTWDGSVIAYQRASWVSYQTQEQRDWARAGLRPFDVIEGATQTVGEFSWVQSQCPDTGMTFEVIVQPQHILEFRPAVHRNTLRVSQVTMLARLGETIRDEQRAETSIVEVVSRSSEFGPLAVRLPYSASTAALMP